MRALALSLGVLLLSATTAARAQTLLDRVLYIVAPYGPDTSNIKHSIMRGLDWIDGETRISVTEPSYEFVHSTTVKRINDCKFEIEEKTPVFRPHYTLDFLKADLENAHAAAAVNRSGRLVPGRLVIPGTRYCLLGGSRMIDNIGVGSCADEFYIEPIFGLEAEMLAAIHGLREFCVPKVS